MLQSLLLERVKFIELLFVNGFMMREFLNIDVLKLLYNESVISIDIYTGQLHNRECFRISLMIGKSYITLPPGFYDIMLQSLLLERVKFIELLFVNGFMMREFLNIDVLKLLYNESVISTDI